MKKDRYSVQMLKIFADALHVKHNITESKVIMCDNNNTVAENIKLYDNHITTATSIAQLSSERIVRNFIVPIDIFDTSRSDGLSIEIYSILSVSIFQDLEECNEHDIITMYSAITGKVIFSIDLEEALNMLRLNIEEFNIEDTKCITLSDIYWLFFMYTQYEFIRSWKISDLKTISE